MTYIEISYDSAQEACGLLNENGIDASPIGFGSLAEENMIESFFERIKDITPEKLDAFLKTL